MENQNQTGNKKSKGAATSLRNILGGGFLTRENTAKHLPFLFFLAFLAVVYIANSYYAEKNIRRIERLQREVKELRYEQVNTKSKLMQTTRQSKVADNLKNKGIRESTVPPNKIFIEEK